MRLCIATITALLLSGCDPVCDEKTWECEDDPVSDVLNHPITEATIVIGEMVSTVSTMQ